MAKTLTKIDAFFTEADSRFALSGTYDEQTLTLFDGDTFFDEVDYCYSERAILTRTNTPLEEFYKLFQRWSEGKGYGFIRSYAALLIEYNPTHNYDGVETITTTTEFGKVVENESEGTTTNTPTLTSTTERSMYGYNSSTDVDADKAVTTAGGEDKTEASGSGSVTESGTETVTVETEKGGNLGLTTNAQLLTGELKLRMYDLQKEAIANFINEYTVEYIEVDGDGFTFASSDTVYTAGVGIDITNFVISVDDEVLNVISTNAENIEALQLSMSTAEDDIDDLQGRMTTAEGEIDALQADMTTVTANLIKTIEKTGTTDAEGKFSLNTNSILYTVIGYKFKYNSVRLLFANSKMVLGTDSDGNWSLYTDVPNTSITIIVYYI